MVEEDRGWVAGAGVGVGGVERFDARVSSRWHRFSPSSLRRLPACVCCIAAATGPPLVLPESLPPPRLHCLLGASELGARGQTKTLLPVAPKMFYILAVKQQIRCTESVCPSVRWHKPREVI